MHPGPMNRGVEISAEVADLPRSVIIDQVRNGVATRMAVLYLLLGQGVDKVLGTDDLDRAPSSQEVLGLMGTIVLKGGRVVDSTGERDADVVIGDDGRIAAVGADLSGDRTLDAGGCVVSPGLVDLHSHLRQPGQEEAETIETGARAAALGGYTCILAMPNTIPAIDHAGVVREVLELGRTAPCDVRTSGAITVGPGRRAARPARRDGRARRAVLHRRRRRRRRRPPDAPGDGVRRRARQGRRPGPALRGPGAGGRRPHARGGVVVPPRASRASPPRPRS